MIANIGARLAARAVAVLGFFVDHWEAVVYVVLAALVAGVFIPRHMFLAVIVSGAIGGGVAIGRLSR